MKNYRYSVLAVSASLACASGTAMAAGFGVTVQSASGGGSSATGHAMAEDASAMWYNPALLSSVEGKQVNGGVAIIDAELKVTNTGSTTPDISGRFIPIVGDNQGEPGGFSATPSIYYKQDISTNKAFGLGINIPFGVSTKYDADSFARYEATESRLKTVNVNPAMSWQINDKWALGAGLNVQYGHALLSKAVDSGLACRKVLAQGPDATQRAELAAAQAAAAATAAGHSAEAVRSIAAAAGSLTALRFANKACTDAGMGNLTDAANDSEMKVEALGFAFGANVGAVYKPNAATTISVGYRSTTKYKLEGDGDFTHKALANLDNLAPGTLRAAGLVDQDATADLDLPASASLAFARKLTDKLTLHGDVTWTQWSSVPEIRIVFPDTKLSDSVTSLEWEDTVRYGVGMTYKMNEKTTLRAGMAMDPTPTPGPQHRTPRAPRSDTAWFSVGMSHRINKKLSLDASFSYLHPEKATINYTAPGAKDGDPDGYFTRADVDSDAFAAALSVSYRF
ncbi:MAG: hypothetical protein CSB47_02525 [Proteobacteria bacterium]|nr:MAG: hypothetical protein CSB47_02525 [Pseudomonadota bacterium]